jgi:hypothetical protein
LRAQVGAGTLDLMHQDMNQTQGHTEPMTAKEATIEKIETKEEAKVPIDPAPGVSTHLLMRIVKHLVVLAKPWCWLGLLSQATTMEWH